MLYPYLNGHVIVFIHDTLVFSKNRMEHDENLRMVLETHRVEKLFSKYIKCHRWSMKCLGHMIHRYGITMNTNNVKTVLDWKQPENITDVRSFISFSYYRRFIDFFP